MDELRNIAIEQLLNTPAGKKLEQAIHIYQEVQENLYALAEKRGEESLTALKIGTVFTIAFMKKIVVGQLPRDFSREDWADIAASVSRYAIRMDGTSYSVFVFDRYAQYIEYSAAVMEKLVAEDVTESIRGLAAELTDRKERLLNGGMTETAYIEDCLWISLEAMIKLLAAFIGVCRGEDANKLYDAVAAFGFEYARYALYRQEQEILTEYIEKQHQLDAALQERYDIFAAALNEKIASIRQLVDNAFSPHFREDLMASAALARAVGVKDEEILCSTEDVDEFFVG